MNAFTNDVVYQGSYPRELLRLNTARKRLIRQLRRPFLWRW